MDLLKGKRAFVLFSGIVVLALFYTLFQSGSPQSSGKIQIGAHAPDIRLTNMAGQTIQLSDFRGKGVLLNFWGSWCGPCVNEMPRLKEASEAGITGVEIVAVNVGESKGTIMEFMNTHQLKFPIMTDPTGEAANSYRVNGLPATFIIDTRGGLNQVIAGELANVEQIKTLMKSVQPKP